MVNPEVAVAMLFSFDSSEEIAQFLAAEGITGFHQMTEACPIANYLNRETGLPVLVDSGSVLFKKTPDIAVSFDNTDAVYDFVNDFDDGEYPELAESYE